MKTCSACHEDLPKDKFSKKQWKLNQRRCKVCIADNREVQQLPPTTNNKPDDDKLDYNEIIRLLDSIVINATDLSPITDEVLFKQPQPLEDCPICFLRMPSIWTGHKYKACCGKIVCSGCTYYRQMMKDSTNLCPFCRTPIHTSNAERNESYYKRIAAGDAEAIFNYGTFYASGIHGYPKDYAKALELWHWAGKLGCANGYHNIGNAYKKGDGVQEDIEKSNHYLELAVIEGHVVARHNLGVYEKQDGNMDRALKHFMIAAGVGHGNSLQRIKELFMEGHATKEDYAQALRAHQAYMDEIRSDQRDKAAADKKYKYYF